MTYRQMKWLILTIPTVAVGVWEYVRHEFLLSYISMELGNWLTPVFVFLVTILFLTRLFDMMERDRKELEEAKVLQAAYREREKIAQELHDGIAQSLFLLNVQVERIEQAAHIDRDLFQQLKKNVHAAHDYVRQAIANLRRPADPVSVPWMQALDSLIEEIRRESDLQFSLDWRLPENRLETKEKVELLALIRESLLNVYKHAHARHVRIVAEETENGGWRCEVADDGRGFDPNDAADQGRYGMKMMEDRAKHMRWRLSIGRRGGETVVTVRKEGSV
jgi:two-component system nitrate/nitrite sensor histidine kinase NarQ